MQDKRAIWEMALENAKNEKANPKKKTVEKKFNFGKELLMTFSNQKSLISSKKVERFAIFLTFLSLSVYYIVSNIDKMHATEFIEVIGIWLAYGGYNSFMNFRDKKIETTQSSDLSDPES